MSAVESNINLKNVDLRTRYGPIVRDEHTFRPTEVSIRLEDLLPRERLLGPVTWSWHRSSEKAVLDHAYEALGIAIEWEPSFAAYPCCSRPLSAGKHTTSPPQPRATLLITAYSECYNVLFNMTSQSNDLLG